MTNELDLTSFLNEQAEEGTVESEGDFTISHQNARRKLAKFSLPRESAWVSKLVQAAVAWNTEKIQAAQTTTETQFFFHTDKPGELPTENDIVETLLSGNVKADSAIEHFCLALRALVEQSGKSFILAINDGDVKPQPVYAGPYYGELSEEERLDQRYDRGMGITLTIRHAPEVTLTSNLGDILEPKGGIPIVLELRAYAYTCPIPLELSGLRLDGFLDSPLFDSGNVPLVLSGIKDLEHSPRSLSLPRRFEEKQLSFKTHKRRARRIYGGDRDFGAVFVLTARPPGNMGPPRRRSSFNWVRDGVVVQSNSFDLETATVGLAVYANAEDLRSDLTGFQLVESEEKRLREQEIVKALQPLLLRRKRSAYSFFREDTDKKSTDDERLDNDEAFRSRVKTLVSGSAVGLFITLVNPPLGLLTTAGSVAKTYASKVLKTDTRSVLERNQELIQDAIESDLTLLGDHLKDWVQGLVVEAGMALEQLALNIADQDSVTAFMKAGQLDPEALVSALHKHKSSDPENSAEYDRLLGQAYRMLGGSRAGVYLRNALDQNPSPELAEELAQYYEEEGKVGLAYLVRQEKYDMRSAPG